MKELTVEEMKKIGGVDYSGCHNDVCCITFDSSVGPLRVCGSYEWYIAY